VSDKLRVFIDSNVLISAMIGVPESAPVVLVDWLAGGQPGELLTSRRNVAEVERNLHKRLPEALPLWREFIARSGIRVVAATSSCRGINAKDAAIVAGALRAKATHFVTGDKRLLAEIRRAASKNMTAVTPREMLDVLLLTGVNTQ
jgi:predicted nucleic acid-binding protein